MKVEVFITRKQPNPEDIDFNNILKTILVPVHEGKQSFKWLGGVVAARIREEGGIPSEIDPEGSGDGIYNVFAIYNSKQVLINPSDKIFEHCLDAEIVTVYAEVSMEFNLDEWGNPVLGDWYKEAYVHDISHNKWLHEIEQWRERLAENPNAELVSGSNFVNIGEIYSPGDIEATLELDFQNIAFKWTSVPLSEMQKTSLKYVLLMEYSTICSIFAHYCGYGRVGERYGITRNEVRHLFHMAEIINKRNAFEDDQKFLDDVFDKSWNLFAKDNSRRADSKSLIISLLSRVQFVEFLIHFAAEINGTIISLGDSLKSSILQPLKAVWNKIHKSYVVYSISDPVMKTSLREYFHVMKNVFLQYSNVDAIIGPQLYLSSYLELLNRAGIIKASQKESCIQCFLEAQLSPLSSRELKNLVFIEFLEACSRAAIQFPHGEGTDENPAKKVRFAFHLIADLYNIHPKK